MKIIDKNWPELVFLLVLGHLVEFPVLYQHTNPLSPELYFEYLHHWWYVGNRDLRLYHSHYVFPDTLRHIQLKLDFRFWGKQRICKNLRTQIEFQYFQARWLILVLQLDSGRMTLDICYITWICKVLAYNLLIKRGSLADCWCQKACCYIPDYLPWSSSS